MQGAENGQGILQGEEVTKAQRAFYRLMQEEYLCAYDRRLMLAIGVSMFGNEEQKKMVGLSAILENELTKQIYLEDSLLAKVSQKGGLC